MDIWKELCVDMEEFEEGLLERFNFESENLTQAVIKTSKIRKDLVIDFAVHYSRMYHRCKCLAACAASEILEANAGLVKAQEKTIDLQEELLKNQSEQLASLQGTVRDEVASVQTAVTTEIRTWSQVAAQNTNQPTTSITPAKLKEVVKSAVVDEDRSRNFMIFNKEEAVNEDTGQVVRDILKDMTEEPMVVECRRIGITGQHGKPRPIKVKLSSADAVSHVLGVQGS